MTQFPFAPESHPVQILYSRLVVNARLGEKE